MKIEPVISLEGKTYGQLSNKEKNIATSLVLSAYFNNSDNSTTNLSNITNLKHSLVCRIVSIEIVPGRDLRALKAQYVLNQKQIAKTLLGFSIL